MTRLLAAIFAIALAASLCHAALSDQPKPKATEPVGAVLETTGVIIGKVTTVIEESLGGGKKKGTLIMADDEGRTKVIPLDNSVEVLDKTFHGITLNQLKKGEKVSVEYTKDKSGAQKAKKVTVV